ncbi:MAG: hypothetical protein GY828_05030 [Candidatus Gracilibacteria bacterium]|nr:hypothetical protein [Candidatus Gracilibacteria bacterium]
MKSYLRSISYATMLSITGCSSFPHEVTSKSVQQEVDSIILKQRVGLEENELQNILKEGKILLQDELQTYANIQNKKASNKYMSNAYFTYVDFQFRSQFNKKYIDLKSKLENELRKGILTKETYLVAIEQQLKPLLVKYNHSFIIPFITLKNFEKEPEYFDEEEKYSDIFNQARQKGLTFRKFETSIIVYTSDGKSLDMFELSDLQLNEKIQKLIEEYGVVNINDYIELSIDQEITITPNYVSDIDIFLGFKVPKFYALKLKYFEEKGYTFKVISGNNSSLTLFVMKDGYTVFDINKNTRSQNNQIDLWLDIFVNNLEQINENKAEKITSPRLEVKGLQKNTIAFVNEVYDNFYDDQGILRTGLKIKDFMPERLIEIGFNHNLPLYAICNQIPSIYNALTQKKINIFELLYTNALDDIKNYTEFISQYNIEEKDYIKTKRSFSEMHFFVWEKMINASKFNLENVLKLADLYIYNHINSTKGSLDDFRGVSPVIVHIVKQYISINPNLYYTDEMKEVFNKYEGLEFIIKKGIHQKIENQETLGQMSGGSFNDFSNSSDLEIVSTIRFRIKNEWLEEFNLSEIERNNIKLAVSRNLALQYIDDLDQLEAKFNDHGKQLIIENIHRLLLTRKNIETTSIFKNYDNYHIAHFGQDVDFDNFGTYVTQKALKTQSGNKRYSLFDAEDIFGKSIDEGNRELGKYYNKFIQNKGTALLLMEGHGTSHSFSVLQKYKERDSLGINTKGFESINISYKKLVDIIIHRQNIKDQLGITEPDMIIFSACRGDYAINFYTALNERSAELNENFIPPIMITAAEAGQNSLGRTTNLDKIIPAALLRHTLDIGNTESSTFGTFLKNHTYHPDVGSDPSLFYPIKINGKWVAQQLG